MVTILTTVTTENNVAKMIILLLGVYHLKTQTLKTKPVSSTKCSQKAHSQKEKTSKNDQR